MPKGGVDLRHVPTLAESKQTAPVTAETTKKRIVIIPQKAAEGKPITPSGVDHEKCAASYTDASGVIIDTVYDEASSSLRFAVSHQGCLSLEDFVIVQAGDSAPFKLLPPSDPNGLVEKGVVLLPSHPERYDSQEQLLAGLCSFIHTYADVPPFWEPLIAHYVLMTWVYDRFTAVPYLRFLGEPQTGKTRLLQITANLAYKAIIAGGATTVSPMFRLMDVYQGTFVIDEADFKHSDLWSEIIKILNSGYMRGVPILRSEKAGNDYEPRAFDPFGPKILSTRQRFGDYALETRCITLETPETSLRPDIPRQLPAAFFQEALDLRNKLLRWRFESVGSIESDESHLLRLEPRLTQIGTPLFSVATDSDFRTELLQFLASHAADQRAERPQAAVIEAIRQLLADNKSQALAVKEVASRAGAIASEWGLDERFSAKRVGHLVRSLGFCPRRTRHGYEFPATASAVRDLAERYRIKEDG